ncbi:hypothetical protein [Metasolibacillus sp.]|uniref:hypothetical protein n=1 Tax=Metasolibacillus sp. TaxID=2703680 RepID=UPI0025D3448C|nr:hypothetical protein [Metasolibacillus sp.]MCT6924747.1 hypothetical protein [Metasolibacillus sp.]MCT6940900.1 hypothetical protein [Metasolibacillus sp.]
MVMESKRSFILLIAIVSTFAIAPIIALVFYTFVQDGQLNMEQLQRLFSQNRLWQTLSNSLLLGLFVIIGTTIIAFPMALIRTKQV